MSISDTVICDSFSHNLSLLFSKYFIFSHAFSSLADLVPRYPVLHVQHRLITRDTYACIDLFIVGQKTFELYFSSKVHTMLQLAVNHLQHEHSESTNSAEAKI